MSEPGNSDNLIPNVASETCFLDLDNSEIEVENELESCDCSLIGLADDSATQISLNVRITKRIADEEATECLQTYLSESNLPDCTANGSAVKEVNCGKAELVKNNKTTNQSDIAISANSSKLSIKNKTDYSEIETNYIPLTKEESLRDHSFSIIKSPANQPLSSIDQFHQLKTRAVDSQEINPKTIYNENMESTKDTKESGSDNELLVNEKSKLLKSGELSQDTSVKVEQDQIQAAEQAQDLEDGEVSDDNGDVPLKVPVCRFYVRNGCSWGNNCRFRHPGSNKQGNYVMFEKKVLPVVNTPLPRAWAPSVLPAFPFNLNNVNTDRYYPQEQPDVPKRAPLLPTPSFKETLLTQENSSKLGDLHQSVPNPDKPKQILWQSRLSTGPPCSTTLQWSPARIRSPSVSPPRYANQVQLEVRSTLSCKPSAKRYRPPSPPRTSATRIRGPHTPPCSPPVRPKAKTQAAPKRQRLYTYLSSSTDSSELSSCTSTSESSEESSFSSDSDEEYWSRSSQRINRTQPFRAPAKSSLRPSIECTPRPSRRHETSDIKRVPRHTSESKSRRHSSRAIKKSSPERDPPRVPTRASRKPISEGNISYPGRREYLLMKLLQVEKQIAKKKKKMNLK